MTRQIMLHVPSNAKKLWSFEGRCECFSGEEDHCAECGAPALKRHHLAIDGKELPDITFSGNDVFLIKSHYRMSFLEAGFEEVNFD